MSHAFAGKSAVISCSVLFKPHLRRLALACLAGAAFAAVLPTAVHAQTDAATPAAKPLVILIGLDGFKPAYLNPADTPHLLRLAAAGTRAQGLISAFPSLTFPNHMSLVSGQTPDHHGIVNNTMTDAQTAQRFTLGSREAVENPFWWSESQPIWVALQQQGKRASTLFWPGSETSIHGVRPNDWLPYEHEMPHERRLQILLEWLSRPVEQRPDFVTLYFSDVDSAGHHGGPDSAEVVAAVRKVDASIGTLLAALQQKALLAQTTVVVVSDHGMAQSPADKVISVQERLARFPAARWEWQGATAGVRLNGEPLDGVMAALADLPHAQCWPKGQLPQRFRFGTHRRIPEVVCLAQVGYSITDNPARTGPLGQHGYDPDHPDMHGLLIASGHRVRQGTVGLVSNLEIYALLCDLLGIVPAPHDGTGKLASQLLQPGS